MDDERDNSLGIFEDLRKQIAKFFDLSELKDLCYDLGIEYEDLHGDTRSDKAREMVLQCQRRNQLYDLIAKCAKERPNLTWEQPRITLLNTQFGKDKGVEILGTSAAQFVRETAEFKTREEKNYREAVIHAEHHHQKLASFAVQHEDDPDFQLCRADFEVWYAKALIYVGETALGIAKLRDVIRDLKSQQAEYQANSLNRQDWNRVIGTALNHIGYANWTNLGHYEYALKEFREAILYLRLIPLPNDQLPTTYDNLGRVYAELGYQVRGSLLIEHGRQLRRQLVNEEIRSARCAISMNSSAQAHLAAGQLNQALKLSKKAISDKNLPARMIGSAKLTQGRVLRYMAADTYMQSDTKVKIGLLNKAESAIKQALATFDEIELEVRLFEANNELGCIHRQLAELADRDGDREKFSMIVQDARRYIQTSIDIVKGRNPTLYVDACVDLAQIFFLMGDRLQAEKCLKDAEDAIPPQHRFGGGAEQTSINPEEYSEGFWHHLGKIATLRGRAAFSNKKDQLAWQESLTQYKIAAAYFGRFLTRPLDFDNKDLYPPYRPQLGSHRIFIAELYEMLASLSAKVEAKEASRLWDETLQELMNQYRELDRWIEPFHSDTVKLMLELNADHITPGSSINDI